MDCLHLVSIDSTIGRFISLPLEIIRKLVLLLGYNNLIVFRHLLITNSIFINSLTSTDIIYLINKHALYTKDHSFEGYKLPNGNFHKRCITITGNANEYKKLIDYFNSKLVGKWKEWRRKNNIWKVYKVRHYTTNSKVVGKWRIHNPYTGLLTQSWKYANGKLQQYILYYDNGDMAISRRYLDNVKVYWKEWDKEGTLTKNIVY